MAGSQPKKSIRAERERLADGGEPLNTEGRTVREIDGALYINPTEYGVRTHDLEKGEQVEVHTTRNAVIITVSNDDE